MKSSAQRMGQAKPNRGGALGKLGPVQDATQVSPGAAVVREQARMVEVLEEWMVQHKKMYEAHAAEQERLVKLLLSCHTETLKEMELAQGEGGGGGGEPRQTLEQEAEGASSPEPTQAAQKEYVSSWRERQESASDALLRTPPKAAGDASRHAGATFRPVQPVDPDDGCSVPPSDFPDGPQEGKGIVKEAEGKGKEEEEEETNSEDLLDAWIHSSGLHTVSKWVKNYRKHPAGWGALLMIHGIPEVSGRLRSKVDNYAIYSALFLSMSMALLTDAPDVATQDCLNDWECHLRKRLYTFCFAAGTASHMLSILLGMAFNNALNEAARDSDVFRMFARGKGFVATVKCQRAFTVGCIADFIALMVAISEYTSWPEAIGGTFVMALIVIYIYVGTAKLLFVNSSIVKYWREELGGKPDKDDPYDLQVAVNQFDHRVKFNDSYFRRLTDCGADTEKAAQVMSEMHHLHLHSAGHHHQSGPTHSVAVAGIF